MNVIKKYIISISITLGLIIIFSFFINILSYLDILNIRTYKVLIMIFLVVSITIGSYLLGYNSINKGYLNGIIFGTIINIITIFISIVSKQELNKEKIIYFIIIIITSLVGSTIGINKKTT